MNRNKGERMSGLEKSGKALWMKWDLIWAFGKKGPLQGERKRQDSPQRGDHSNQEQ